MALQFIDGFDHYAVTDGGLKYNGFSMASMQTGRSGSGQCARANNAGGATKTFSSSNSTWVVGFAFRPSQLSNGSRFLTFDVVSGSTTNQINLRMTNTGQLQVFRNNTQLGDSGTNLFSTNVFVYLECKVVINGSTGSVEVHVNGNTWCNLTSKNTDNASTGNANSIQFGLLDFSNTINFDFDDLYICDGSGSPNNTFLGDVAVQTLYPTGAGNATQWTPSTGSNWQNVDDAQLNKDTDYNSDSTVGDIDSYQMADLTGTIGSIVGVQTVLAVRKDDAGSRSVARVTRSGGTNFFGSTISLGTSYVLLADMQENDPNTSAAWTSSAVNSAEGGIKVIS